MRRILLTDDHKDESTSALPNSNWSWIGAALALTLLLLWPAWYNGQPLFFPDSIGYERAGAVTLAATHVIDEPEYSSSKTAANLGTGPVAIAHGGMAHGGLAHGSDGVTTARSPYYGVPMTLAIEAGGVWLVAVLQSLGVAAALLMAMRRLRIPLPWAVATVAILALAGGLGVYAEALMPDVFIGLMVLGFAMLLAVPKLPRSEQLLWLLAVIVAMLFHKAFLAVGILLTGGAAACARKLLLERATIVLLAACCVVAATGHLLVEVSVRQVTGRAPLSVPFLLARYAASPVLGDYLRDNCSPPRFVICKYRARLPMAPDAFLWGPQNVYISVSNTDRQAIAAESGAVLRGAIAARPADAASEAIHGAAVQLFTVGMSDFALGVPRSTSIDARMAPALADYPQSAIARRAFPLGPLGTLALGVYLIAAFVIVANFPATMRSVTSGVRFDRPRVAVLLTVLTGGVVLNAIVSGMLSGVFERYQGRIAWLLPFGAVVLWQARQHRAAPVALRLAPAHLKL